MSNLSDAKFDFGEELIYTTEHLGETISKTVKVLNIGTSSKGVVYVVSTGELKPPSLIVAESELSRK